MTYDWIANISVFFDSCVQTNRERNSKYAKYIHILIHILYNSIFSIILAFILQVSFIVFFSKSIDNKLIDSNFFSIYFSFFILVLLLLMGTVLLNFGNLNFSIPKFIINFILIIHESRIGTRLMRIVLFLPLYISSIFYITAHILSIISFHSQYLAETIIVSTLVIIVLFTVMIYSDATIDESERAIRQFILWSLLFAVLSVITIGRVYFYIQGGSSTQTSLDITLLIFTLVFNIAFVIDKARAYYSNIPDTIQNTINIVWIAKLDTYSFDAIMDKTLEGLGQVYKLFRIVSFEWRWGNKKKVIRHLITTLIIIVVGYYILMVLGFLFLENNLSIVIVHYLDDKWTKMFNGNTKLSHYILGFIAFLSCTIYLILDRLNLLNSKGVEFLYKVFIIRIPFFLLYFVFKFIGGSSSLNIFSLYLAFLLYIRSKIISIRRFKLTDVLHPPNITKNLLYDVEITKKAE